MCLVKNLKKVLNLNIFWTFTKFTQKGPDRIFPKFKFLHLLTFPDHMLKSFERCKNLGEYCQSGPLFSEVLDLYYIHLPYDNFHYMIKSWFSCCYFWKMEGVIWHEWLSELCNVHNSLPKLPPKVYSLKFLKCQCSIKITLIIGNSHRSSLQIFRTAFYRIRYD